jgi:hypothetical protein
MQFPAQGKPPVGVVIDSDLRDIDDVLALALLYGLEGKGEARVVSVSVSHSSLKAAALCEVIGRFYAGAVSGAFGGMGRTLPIGLAAEARPLPDTPMIDAPLAKRGADGKPAYDHGIEKLNDTAEVPALIRNAFTAQQDGNCIVVLAGPASQLARVLELPGSKDLIARKVRLLSIAAGAYPEGAAEPGIQADVAAARKLFAEWPTPIVAAGAEIGAGLPFPGETVERDFAWSPNHPVADAYRARGAMPYDGPTWAMSAVLQAVRPGDGYFQLSDPGTIRVLDDGRTRFTAAPGGKHRYLILDPAQKARIVQVYTELASARPVPRPSRFRPPQQQQQTQPAQTPKPQDPKPPQR